MVRQTLTRFQLFKLATLFQGGVLLLGLLIAWLVGINLADVWTWSGEAVLRGVLATIPMLIVFGVTEWFDWDPFSRIRTFLNDTLGPVIVRCTIWELLYLAFLAGISEEILFRGAIQNSLALWSLVGGVLVTNLLFGICHAFSQAYFVLATAAGFYLSWVAGWHDQNLLPAVLAHTLYDFAALLFIRWDAAREAGPSLPSRAGIEAEPSKWRDVESSSNVFEREPGEDSIHNSPDPFPETGESGENS